MKTNNSLAKRRNVRLAKVERTENMDWAKTVGNDDRSVSKNPRALHAIPPPLHTWRLQAPLSKVK